MYMYVQVTHFILVALSTENMDQQDIEDVHRQRDCLIFLIIRVLMLYY